MRNPFKRGVQWEQLEMFDPKEGTGMWDDPTNGPIRRQHISNMMELESPERDGVGPSKHETKIFNALDRSNVPLQHIADADKAGQTIRSNERLLASGHYTPWPSISHSGKNVFADSYSAIKWGAMDINNARPTTVVHEFGHARHDLLVDRHMPKQLGTDTSTYAPIKSRFLDMVTGQKDQTASTLQEGVATGYSTLYSGERDRSYRRFMRKAGPEYLERFQHAQNFVKETGDAPFSFKDMDISKPQPEKPEGEQLRLF